MIENKSLRSKIFDILNIVILIAITLICIVPVWYVLCVSLSSREAVNAGKVALWPVGFNLLSYKKIMGETAFLVRFWYLLREFCWEPESVWYVSLWQHIHYPEQKNSSRKEISLCGYSCSACYLTEERFRGISP